MKRTRTEVRVSLPRATESLRARIAERVRYLRGALRAEHAHYAAAGIGCDRADCLHLMALRVPEEGITESAMVGAVACVHRFAPRFAAAVLDDEAFAWRIPLKLGPFDSTTPFPCPQSTVGAAWAAGILDSGRPLPRSFPVDPRAGRVVPASSELDDDGELATAGLHTVWWGSGFWPDNVTTEEVLHALRKTGDAEACAAADGETGVIYGHSVDGSLVMAPDAPRDHVGWVAGPHGPRWDPATYQRHVAQQLAHVMTRDRLTERTRFSLTGGHAGADWITAQEAVRRHEQGDAQCSAIVGRHVLSHLRERWTPRAVAQVLSVVRRIEARQRDARFFPLPAGQEARAPFEVMAQGGSYADEGRDLWRVNDRRGAGLRVVWDGKPRGEQLSLAFAMRDVVQAEVFRDILRELKAEGLRDYVILHRMAAEQGRTGRLLWTWEAHKRATAHERRVSDGNKSDAAARDAVMNTIWRLAAAELHVEVMRNGSRAWKVIGEAPLVNVVGGVEHGGRIEGLELVLNPALYDGARADGSDDLQRYFTQLPEAVLRLPSLPFGLAVMLGFRFRYARDAGGLVELRADQLHAYMDAARWRGGHRADADATLRRALGEIARAMGEGCTFEPVEGGSYRVTPPRAWVDAVIHEVPPELPPSRSKTPRNGAELLAWREARDLSQAGAAKALGVSVRTVKRAEKCRASTLPRSFRAADWNALPPPSKRLPDPSEG